MRAADGRVVHLDVQIVEADITLQIFAGARMRFDGNDPSGSSHARGGGQTQLAYIRAYVDEGLSRLQVATDKINIVGTKSAIAPEPRGHRAGIETHPVSGREAKGDEAAQPG